MSQLPLIIVNPQSASGTTGARWAVMASNVRNNFGAFEVKFTSRIGEAREIANREARQGRNFIIACGGDGTINETANGILDSGCDAELGVLPSGTGGDFRRTLQMPTDVASAARALKCGVTRSIDVGRVRFINLEGEEEARHFLGISSAGIASKVLEIVKDDSASWLPAPVTKMLGGQIGFAAATLSAVMRYVKPELAFRVDDREERRMKIISFAVCNARYFGGGMNIAPDARLDDGKLDLVIIGDVGMSRIVTNIHKLYAGTHLGLDGVMHDTVTRVEVRVTNQEAVMIETDGEIVGCLPASYEIMRGALRVRCAR